LLTAFVLWILALCGIFLVLLVRAFGEKVFDIIESAPDRLREVDGIGPIRAASILAAWAEQEGRARNHGFPPHPRRQ
jgi:hypothetical protein